MFIVSHVCAEFHDTKGNDTFTITPSMIRGFIEAPDFIREDPLYQLLLSDGSVEAGITKERKQILENDPDHGIDGAGKAIRKPARIAGEQKASRQPG